MTDDDLKAKLLEARLEGFKAAIDLLERIEAIKARTRPRIVHRQPAPQRYDWTDWACGIPLIDKMMGIK